MFNQHDQVHLKEQATSLLNTNDVSSIIDVTESYLIDSRFMVAITSQANKVQ